MIIKDLNGVVNLKFITIDQDNDAWEMKVKATADNTPSNRAKMIFTYGQDSIFQIKGDGNAKLAGMLTENSDSRLKKNIVPMINILKRLMLLSGYTYNWIDPSKSEELQIGLLAQEVQAQFPELVQESDNGTLSVSYTRFVPLLIQGLREQEESIREQEERIQYLEKIVQQLVDLQED
ncbi:MAG: tail fiber domain-containing protein [Saprospiraceae bacterium]|nr:tail fiber domain-containing protein [Saprospiraceae bacterium]